MLTQRHSQAATLFSGKGIALTAVTLAALLVGSGISRAGLIMYEFSADIEELPPRRGQPATGGGMISGTFSYEIGDSTPDFTDPGPDGNRDRFFLSTANFAFTGGEFDGITDPGAIQFGGAAYVQEYRDASLDLHGILFSGNDNPINSIAFYWDNLDVINAGTTQAFDVNRPIFSGVVIKSDGAEFNFLNFEISELDSGGPPPAPVPEPTSLALLATGACSFIGYGWRRKRKLAA